MINTFTVNGKNYVARQVDFNLVCDLDRYGASLTQMHTGNGAFGLARAYLAVCGNMTVAQAGKEIEQDYMNGGELGTVINVLTKEMEDSGFFKKMLEEIAQKITEETKKANPTTEESK